MTTKPRASPEPEPEAARALRTALGLPEGALGPFLDHIDQFCHAHGGEARYRELLALVRRQRVER